MEPRLKEQSCSVLLPLYNSSQFIRESLDSIIPGLRENDELLIINDGSEDISAVSLLSLKKLDPRINVINKQHSGLVDTLNLGIKECRNELIARADIDDKYNPSRISLQAEFMFHHSNCAAVFSDYEIRSSKDDILGFIPTAITPLLTRFSLLNPQRTPHPSVMFRKSAVQAVGFYKKDDFPGEDLSLWIHLSANFEISTIPKTLLYYRINQSGITNRFQNQMVERTKTLVSKLAKSLLVDEVLDDIGRSFAIYEAHENSMDRKILFLRDLLKYMYISDKNDFSKVIKHPAVSSLKHLMRPSAIRSISRLRREQRIRKLNRTRNL